MNREALPNAPGNNEAYPWAAMDHPCGSIPLFKLQVLARQLSTPSPQPPARNTVQARNARLHDVLTEALLIETDSDLKEEPRVARGKSA